MFNGKPDDVFFVANHGDPPYLLRPLIPSTHEIEIAHQQTIQPRKLLVLRKSQMIGYKSIPTPLARLHINECRSNRIWHNAHDFAQNNPQIATLPIGRALHNRTNGNS